MNIEQIVESYVKPELLVIAVVLYFVGMGIKNTEKIADKYIPIILGVLGVVIAGIYVLATSTLNGYQSILMAIFTSLIQGILVAGTSVYANQLIKQSQKTE